MVICLTLIMYAHSSPFTIADMEFGGDMVFDAKYDRNGQLIGKTLGCLVASAVDAVKTLYLT